MLQSAKTMTYYKDLQQHKRFLLSYHHHLLMSSPFQNLFGLPLPPLAPLLWIKLPSNPLLRPQSHPLWFEPLWFTSRQMGPQSSRSSTSFVAIGSLTGTILSPRSCLLKKTTEAITPGSNLTPYSTPCSYAGP